MAEVKETKEIKEEKKPVERELSIRELKKQVREESAPKVEEANPTINEEVKRTPVNQEKKTEFKGEFKIGKATRYAYIRKEPNLNSDEVLLLRRGDRLSYIESPIKNGYVPVVAASGEEGFFIREHIK